MLTLIILFTIKKKLFFLGHDRDYHRKNDDRERSKIIRKKEF